MVQVVLHKSGECSVAFPDDLDISLCNRVMQSIRSTKEERYWGYAVVSTGFARLRFPLVLGDYVLSQRLRGRKHGMRTDEWAQSSGLVYDHLLVYPLGGYDESTAADRAREIAPDMVRLVSFLFDHPMALIGTGQLLWDPRNRRGPESVHESLAALGAHGIGQANLTDTDPHTHVAWLTSDTDTELFFHTMASMDDDPRGKVEDCVVTYARALLSASPEPGFERYLDPSLAITQWITIVEALSDPPEDQGVCAECGRPRRTGERRRIREFAKRLDSAVTSGALTKLRDVRHAFAHAASRSASDYTGLPLRTFVDKSDRLGAVGPQRARRLARAAILHSVVQSPEFAQPQPSSAASEE